MKCQNNVGFTLIELLVVVLIIGILAAVALPQYTKAVERSRTSEAVQRLGDMATAQQIIYMQNGTFASSYDDVHDLGDVTIPASNNTGSYTVAVNNNTDNSETTMVAERTSGQYKGSKLQLTVESSGKITKTCDGTDTEFCNLVKSAGYN